MRVYLAKRGINIAKAFLILVAINTEHTFTVRSRSPPWEVGWSKSCVENQQWVFMSSYYNMDILSILTQVYDYSFRTL